MLTLDQIAYNILNMYSGGRSTNNEHVSLRQIKEWVHQYRALYVRRDLNPNRRYREFEQTLPDITLSNFAAGMPDDPTVKRTAELPVFIRLKDEEAVVYAGPSNGFNPYQVVDNNSARWRGFSNYTATQPISFIQDRRLYVKNTEDSTVTIRGIFENPEEVHEFLVDLGHQEEDAEWLYPLPRDIAESIVKNILETELRITKSSPLDLMANTVPDEKVAPAGE